MNLFGCSSAGEATQILVVGAACRISSTPIDVEGVNFTSFDDLSSDLLSRTMTNIVLSALWTEEFDAMDLAGKLSMLGYVGRYRVVSDRVPKPELIASEIGKVYPFLDFRVLLYAGRGSLVSFAEHGA